MSLQIKPGVRALGIRPELNLAILVASLLWKERGKVLTITSLIEGRHSRGSLHVSGCAVDLRTSDLVLEERESFKAALAQRLGGEYDVVLEDDHMHVEWQPKEPLNG